MNNATHLSLISMIQIKRITLYSVLVIAIGLLATTIKPIAVAATCECASACNDRCPNCKLEIKKEPVKKHFYTVECKTICIPRVTCPWEKPCERICDGTCASDCCTCPFPCKGARTRKVKVIRKFEYECEKCKYKWTPTCSGDDCDGASCTAAPGTTSKENIVPPSPPSADRSARISDFFNIIPLWK